MDDAFASLVTIQVGEPRDLGRAGAAEPMEQAWRSGILKEPVSGPVRVGRTGVEGDGQADRANHGGLDKDIGRLR